MPGQPEPQQKYEILPGGLVIIDPLPPYKSQSIYKQIVSAKFDLNKIDRLREAQQILNELRAKPADIIAFVAHFDHHNQISWASTTHQAEENACPSCILEHCQLMHKPMLFKTRLDQKFLENPDLRENARMLFRRPNFSWNKNDKPIFGTVDYIDAHQQSIYVEMDHDCPEQNVEYEAIILPSSLIFRSRCRTLDWIHMNCGWGEFVFPDLRDALTEELIPEPEYNKLEKNFLKHAAFSPQRNFNANQRRAIHAIVSGHHGPCPYILFGPPGTGKTVTLVEAIRLLLLTNDEPERSVLVCTPSNTAADAFVLELLRTGAFPAEQLLRIFSMSKKVQEQNERLLQSRELLCICDLNGVTQFGIPPKEELLQKRVVICTLNTSTYLVNGGLVDCFSHIIIDEAGQADELEALIPIVGLSTPHCQSALQRGSSKSPHRQYSGTRVVLAGDPQQLGPVQTCEALKRMAKPMSLIERLIGHERDRNFFHFDKRVTTMLEENYRSHPALITIPSQLYYGGKLRSSAPIHEKNTLCQWANLPKKDFPLFWHAVEEVEDCEDSGHSYGNRAEKELVYQYVKALFMLGIRPDEIGIITPYKYQVKLLRQRCRHYPEMLIDSVERFQGSERRIIIISTVRSTGIGFLDCEKRFNTAVTRPKELLIIVGSRNNMRQVAGWNQLIHYCEENNALIGQTELKVIQKQKNDRNRVDKVEALGREFGGMNMADCLKRAKPVVQNTGGLYYRFDGIRENEIERQLKQRSRLGCLSKLSESLSFGEPTSSNASFHISASQFNNSTTNSSVSHLLDAMEIDDVQQEKEEEGIESYTLKDAIASEKQRRRENALKKVMEMFEQKLGMAIGEGSGSTTTSSSSPDEDEFESTSSHGMSPQLPLDDDLPQGKGDQKQPSCSSTATGSIVDMKKLGKIMKRLNFEEE